MECQAGKAMIQEVKKAIERMHRLTGIPRSEIVSASGGDAELQHQLGHVLGAVIDVRFTPDATKLLRSSEMTRCANKRHIWCSRSECACHASVSFGRKATRTCNGMRPAHR
jgi:hypothetical protein